jgi:hypothetical protein
MRTMMIAPIYLEDFQSYHVKNDVREERGILGKYDVTDNAKPLLPEALLLNLYLDNKRGQKSSNLCKDCSSSTRPILLYDI